ncbi:hypothetical protein NKR23_g1527, partial [Pleurostoma richardsiae]
MEAVSLLRPSTAAAARGCCLSASRGSSIQQRLGGGVIQLPARRHKSTANRTKRALSVPPHPSFLAHGAPVEQQQQLQQDHIIFNPPSSAPSVFHTPFKFLPRSDPRRRANLTALFAQSTTIHLGGSGSGSGSSTSSPGPSVAA